MNRHACRIVIVRTLYEIDIRKYENLDNELLHNIINFAFDPTNESSEVALKEEDENYQEIKNTIVGIMEKQTEIDKIIHNSLDKYTIDRLNFVDRSIIRLAVYEMLNTNLASGIIINEAVEISKEYTNLDDGLQSKFNNKLLDKISKDLRNDK
ncbi:MAG: transcription antitermination factor NusB [Bacilli bacterium]|nr:transcription antitermination factor NusB [Bacilli bacterium]